jgi:iron-sulfur cluster repair protein YtfE (RIC family)
MTSENPSQPIAPEAQAFKTSEQLLSSDHAELDELLQALIESFDKSDPAGIFARLDRFWARLAMHIRAEHLHLFPSILDVMGQVSEASDNAQSGNVRDVIKILRNDHDFFMKELARAVKLMRAVERNSEAIKEVREMIMLLTTRLAQHNKIEGETIYDLPSRVLTTSQQSILLTGLYRELHNAPSRFTELNDEQTERA